MWGVLRKVPRPHNRKRAMNSARMTTTARRVPGLNRRPGPARLAACAPLGPCGPAAEGPGRPTSACLGSPGESQRPHPCASGDIPFPEGQADPGERYSRQIALFGDAGQQQLTAASVVLIGLGGLGSHVAQQLAYLGVRRFTLLDGDTVGVTDLNRLVGATGADVGILKAHVVARRIRSILPAADVRVIAEPVPVAGLDRGSALGSATAVIAGVDSDTARLILTELCSIAGVPYIDAATGISRADGEVVYGGRVVVAGPAGGCLFCRGELDRREDPSQAKSAPERQAGPAGNGRAGRASVVTINGVVASLAATETACLISGLRPPYGMLTYTAHEGIVTRDGDLPARHCPYCTRWAASRGQLPDDR
jgi:molybdopterin-synthase adenylyltransferase